MPKPKGDKEEPKKLEDCQPGATKSQVHDALRIIANTKVESEKKS